MRAHKAFYHAAGARLAVDLQIGENMFVRLIIDWRSGVEAFLRNLVMIQLLTLEQGTRHQVIEVTNI